VYRKDESLSVYGQRECEYVKSTRSTGILGGDMRSREREGDWRLRRVAWHMTQGRSAATVMPLAGYGRVFLRRAPAHASCCSHYFNTSILRYLTLCYKLERLL